MTLTIIRFFTRKSSRFLILLAVGLLTVITHLYFAVSKVPEDAQLISRTGQELPETGLRRIDIPKLELQNVIPPPPKPGVDVQQTRLQRYQEWCNKTSKVREMKGTCIANDEKKVLYCPVPNASSNSWKLAMMLSTSEFKRLHPDRGLSNVFTGRANNYTDIMKEMDGGAEIFTKYGLRLVRLDETNVSEIYKDYFKFTFVQEPFHRLLSSYQDKLLRQAASDQHDPTNDIQHSRKDEEPINVKVLTSFMQFLLYINKLDQHAQVDPHLDTYTHILTPCIIYFDYIGKMETLVEDGKIVLERLFQGQTFDDMLPKQNTYSSSLPADEYYKRVDKDIIKGIAERFAHDFELYGYEPTLFL